MHLLLSCKTKVNFLILPNRDTRFVSRFWSMLQSTMDLQLKFSTTYPPQMDGQSKRTIKTLEGMLKACALGLKKD